MSEMNTATFYVATDGNDAWSGTAPRPNSDRTDGPFAEIDAAVRASRNLGGRTARRIVIAAGTYLLEEGILLETGDSGLSIEAAPGEEVVLCGGRRVTGWQPDGENLWAASLPEVAEGTWDFRMLIVNGRFCHRARVPEQGRFTHLSEFKVPWMSTTGGGWKRKPTEEELTTLRYRPEDLGSQLDVKNAELTVHHMWDESVVGIAEIDRENCTLRFSNPSGHPPGAFGVDEYVIWNVREGLTRPGQWYLDRTEGKVVYWPLPDEDPAETEVFAPCTESIIRIQGAEDEPARNLTIRGLTLSVTNTPLEAGGFGAGKFDGALSISDAENCCVEDVKVVNVGGQGLKAQRTSRLAIRRCHIRDTGACGVILRGDGTEVSDCRIHHVGVSYPSAIGLWVSGSDALLEHNEIHDTPYTGIAGSGRDHRIVNNRIHHNMLELHDGGGIYITFCQRIVLRGNFIHDVPELGRYGSSAYYLDEQAEDCLVEGNLSLRVARPSHNHMAKGNTIRNNVFITDGDATLTFPKSSDYVFEKNVIRSSGKICFTNPKAITELRDNIIFSASGSVDGRPLDGYQKGIPAPLTEHGEFVPDDPLLSEYEDGKVTFRRSSPARRLGIQPIDVSSAGVRGVR